jgi:hypothetical protein
MAHTLLNAGVAARFEPKPHVSAREHAMTPELAVWVLIAGLIGLVWVFTCAILTEDQPAAEVSGPSDGDRDSDHATPQNPQRRAAA